MNIKEDSFAKKSVNDIVNDMLDKYPDPVDAFEKAQSLLVNNDGFLSNDSKEKLKSAVDILKNNAERIDNDVKQMGFKDLMDETWNWFKKKPEEKHLVRLWVYPPFKDTPTVLDGYITNYDDPGMDKLVQAMRRLHPKSIIYARSDDLGNKTIYENSNGEYRIICTNHDNQKTIYNSKSAELANKLAKQLFDTNGYKQILIKKDNDVLNTFGDTAIDTKTNSNNTHSTHSTKPEKIGSIGDNLKNVLSPNKFVGATLLGAMLGIDPAIIKAGKDSLDKAGITDLKNAIRNKLRSKKEDSDDYKKSSDAFVQDSYVNRQNDIANLDERLGYELHDIHPDMDDKRKPKWHMTLNNRNHIVDLENHKGLKGEVLYCLNGIAPFDMENPKDGDVVYIREKIPYNITDKGNFVYKNGDNFRITVAQFKKMINDPANAEVLEKFNKAHPETPEELKIIDTFAKKQMDKKYPEWEKANNKKYNLDMYPIEIKARIYKKYKEELEPSMVNPNPHKLTSEEVFNEFGLPYFNKIISNLTGRNDVMDKLLKNITNTDDKIAAADEYQNIILNLLDKDELTANNIEKYYVTLPEKYGWITAVNTMFDNKITNLKNTINSADIDQETKQELLNSLNSDLSKIKNKTQTQAGKFTYSDPTKIDNKLMNDLYIKYNLMTIMQVIKKAIGNDENKKQAFNDKKNQLLADRIDGMKLVSELRDWYNNYLLTNEISDTPTLADDWEDIANNTFYTVNKATGKNVGLLKQIENKVYRISDKLKDYRGYNIRDKYYKLLQDKIAEWKKNYPNGNEPQFGEELNSFLANLKDEEQIKRSKSNSDELQKYL